MDDAVRLGLREKTRAEKLRGFGTGLAVVLAVFALLAWRRHRAWAPWDAGASVVAGLLAWKAPESFGWVYGPWMKFADLLAEVNTFLIIGVLYYAVFTPYALILRALGRDPLARGEGWIAREPAGGPETYERAF